MKTVWKAPGGHTYMAPVDQTERIWIRDESARDGLEVDLERPIRLWKAAGTRSRTLVHAATFILPLVGGQSTIIDGRAVLWLMETFEVDVEVRITSERVSRLLPAHRDELI